jgi:hypothetical protein
LNIEYNAYNEFKRHVFSSIFPTSPQMGVNGEIGQILPIITKKNKFERIGYRKVYLLF